MSSVSANSDIDLSYLEDAGVPFAFFDLTEEGLNRYLIRVGRDLVEMIDAFSGAPVSEFAVDLVSEEGALIPSFGHLHRPTGSHGAATIWFENLGRIARTPTSLMAYVVAGSVRLVNARNGNLRQLLDRQIFIESAHPTDPAVQLIARLREIAAKGYLEAPVEGPTAVGRLIQLELGISMKPDGSPHWEGIQVTAHRSERNRSTLFAAVPDWHRSRYRSSRELLDAFGYERSGGRKLMCTLSSTRSNSQGLRLQVDRSSGRLMVISDEDSAPIVQWDIELLEARLAKKHGETVWVKADSKTVDGKEHLRFVAARYTRGPLVSELTTLLDDGSVTVDFLIGEQGDKGYLFKILPKDQARLFPNSTDIPLL